MKIFCDENCNECPIILHKNSRQLTYIMNLLYEKFGDEMYQIIQSNCPNMTVCYDCRIDDFVHREDGCEITHCLEGAYPLSPATPPDSGGMTIVRENKWPDYILWSAIALVVGFLLFVLVFVAFVM